MEFRLLGPLDVSGPGGPLPALAPRQQVVLAMLLLEANRVVPVDRLIRAVWGEDPPPTAKAQIHICISSLRRLLGGIGVAGAIATRPPGYSISLPEEDLDLRAFERLARDGRAACAGERLAEAAQAYGAALALWRGDPLAGVSSELVTSITARLVERRLRVIEEFSDVRLRLGDHHLLVDELSEVAAANPLHERLQAQFMVALSRAGRRTEALSCFRRTRDRFVEELGMEPGAELQRVMRMILSGDGEEQAGPKPLTDIANVPRQLPARIGDVVGRAELCIRARATLDAEPDVARGIRMVVLTGSAGMGKTALALHIAHEVCASFPHGQLFAQLSGSASPHELLEQFLRALGVTNTKIPDSLAERAAMFRSQLADRRVLVVLDDAADENQVRPLLPGGGGCGVVITGRRRLSALPGAEHLTVGPLDQDGAIELLGVMLGHQRVIAERESAHRLVELCGCWPFALHIVGARLANRLYWTIARMVERLEDSKLCLDELVHGPLDVRTGLASTYAALPAGPKRLLRLLSALEVASFPSWVSGQLLGRGEADPGDLVQSLVDAGLVEVEQLAGQPIRLRVGWLVRAFAKERLGLEEQPERLYEAASRVLGASLITADEARGHAEDWRAAYAIALSAVNGADSREAADLLEGSLRSLRLFEQRFEYVAEQLTSITLLFDELARPPSRIAAMHNLAILHRLRGEVYEAIQRYEQSVNTLSAGAA